MAILSKILIFPIKSLDGVSVSEATITPGGSLELDREFAIFDQQDQVVNGKRTAKIHQVRSQYDLSQRRVMLSVQDTAPQSFSLDHDQAGINDWFGAFLGFPVKLRQNQTIGFPDDVTSTGPTIISVASLETTAGWFPTLSVESMRSRLRTNLEFSGTEPFWEDALYSSPEPVFHIGAVAVQGINPCQRCIVPTRDQLTGEKYAGFQKVIGDRRRESLPSWADPTAFNHYYRLAVNTRIASSEVGKVIKVGDSCRLAMEATHP